MKNTQIHNLHVPIPADLYKELKNASACSGFPATKLVREAIKQWLQHRKNATIENAIRDYAAHYAGSNFDLDKDLEAVGIDSLLQESEQDEKR